MFKKLDFKKLNYSELDRIDGHDIKRDEMHSFYQTFDFLELIKKWPEIVGPKLATVTSPLKIRQGSLFVITKHASYSQELSFLGETIKKEIFKFFPHLRSVIHKLAFQTQESFFDEKLALEKSKKEIPQLHPQSPKYKILKTEAERLFADVQDPDLKASLVSLFIQSK